MVIVSCVLISIVIPHDFLWLLSRFVDHPQNICLGGTVMLIQLSHENSVVVDFDHRSTTFFRFNLPFWRKYLWRFIGEDWMLCSD